MARGISAVPDKATPAPDSSGAGAASRPWWETRWMVALAIAAAMAPLLYPSIPPLVDLLGHMGRYRVELDHSVWLDRYYSFHWAMIGNLGVDLLVMALAPLIGLEPAVKLIVIAIPALTVAGFLWVAREVHGKIPPAAYFAIPFAYGHPFLFGFVNFALSMAMAFLAFGLWLRLSRLDHIRLRQWLFVPISVIVFFTHTYGWGALGLLCFSAEAVRLHDRGEPWFRAGFHAAINASVMALPVIMTLMWRERSAGNTIDWFNWNTKIIWLKTTLRDRWEWFDIAALAAIGLVFLEALRNPRITYSRNLAFSGLVLVACFLVLPRIVFGSAYADMRLMPYIFAVFLLAIRFRGKTPRKLGRAIALIAVLFCAVRLGGNTLSLAIAGNDQSAKLQTLDRLPVGARVLTIVNLDCGKVWELPRNSHIGAMVVVRREGFSNDQWLMDGLNLLSLKYTKPGYFAGDPSEIVRPRRCPDKLHLTVDQSLAAFPRADFDYLWMVDIKTFDERLVAGLQPVWRKPGSILYRLHP